MDIFNILESLVILFVLLAQARSFLKTRTTIDTFKDGLAQNANAYTYEPRYFSLDELTTFGGDTLLKLSAERTVQTDEYRERNNIISVNHKTPLSITIVTALNTYLLKNQGVAADFHLVKDIVERNSDAVEQEIEGALPMPLYLGLLGTMISIVLGLFAMPDMSGSEDIGAAAGSGIQQLLSGVKVAMIASAVGLGMTTFNSWRYRDTKTEVERRKNHFYTFIQTNILPAMTQSAVSVLTTLQDKFLKFSQDFGTQINSLRSAVNMSTRGLENQAKAIEMLEKMNVNEVATSSIKMFGELKGSFDQLQKFQQYLSQLNEMVDNSATLNTQLNALLHRVDFVETIGTQLTEILGRSNTLQNFMLSHVTELEAFRSTAKESVNMGKQQLLETVAQTNVAINGGATDLQKYVGSAMLDFRQFMTTQDAELKSLVEQSRQLSHIDQFNKQISQILLQNQQQQGRLEQQFAQLNNTQTDMANAVRELTKTLAERPSQGLGKQIKRIFGRW